MIWFVELLRSRPAFHPLPTPLPALLPRKRLELLPAVVGRAADVIEYFCAPVVVPGRVLVKRTYRVCGRCSTFVQGCGWGRAPTFHPARPMRFRSGGT